MFRFSFNEHQLIELASAAECAAEADLRADEERRKRQKAIVAAILLLLEQMNRTKRLMLAQESFLASLQVHVKMRTMFSSSKYCLTRKSQLILRDVFQKQLEIKRHFRLSLATFRRVCQLLNTGKDHGWPEMLEVLVFLYWLASGVAYRSVAAKFGMPKSTVSDIIHRTMGKLLHSLHRVVYLPKDEQEIVAIGQGFVAISGSEAFSNVAGCVDCFHVAIKPPKSQEEYYVNERLHHSIKCQVIVDHQGLVRDLFVGFPGSVSDQHVLNLSPVHQKAIFPPKGCVLLGDAAYQCKELPIGVLTPYAESTTNQASLRFNEVHKTAWLIGYKAVLSMKGRWNRIFLPNLEATNRLAPKVAAACVILHNLAVLSGDRVVQDLTTPKNTPHAKTPGRLPSTEVVELRERYAKAVCAAEITPTPLDHCYIATKQTA